ncbi:MAG TPA: TonB-dependent receptor [Crocinitomicaceae bacterium]|nr:TonB-dependent receptor [Crocinitomicaceae bacterium]
MKKINILIVSLFLTTLAFGQKGYLKGVVYEKATNETVIGAVIKNINDLSVGTVTDEFGNYFFELAPGKYKFTCGSIDLGSETFEVVIKENDTTFHDITLSSVSSVIETVVVSSSKYEQKLEEQIVSMEVLKPKVLENKNATTIDGAIETTGGVSIIDGDPQIRGGSGFTFGVGSRVLIVVDDLPLLSGDAGKPEWSYIPVENIEQIEIIKGASSVLYSSSAINGVINVRTAYPRSKPKTKINVSTGYYSKPKSPANNWYADTSYQGFTNINFLHSRKIKNWDFVVGGNFNVDQGYIGPAPQEKYKPEDLKIALNLVDSFPVYSNKDMLKVRGRVNFNLRHINKKVKGLTYGINGNAMYNKTTQAYAWLDDSAGLYKSYPGALFLMNQRMLNLDPYIKYMAENGVNHSLNTRVYFSDSKMSNNQEYSGTLYYAEYQAHKRFKSIDLSVVGGMVANLATSKSILYATAGKPLNLNENYAAFVQIDKKMWHILNLSGGVRYEYFQTNKNRSEGIPIFRGGANLQVTKGTFLRMSAGQGFRYPTITEQFLLTRAGLFGSYANPDLKPEKSLSFEIGLKQGYKFGSLMGYVDVAAFYQKYTNTIEYLFGVWNPKFTVAGFEFLNTGKSRVRGIDASIVGMTDEKKDFRVNYMVGYTYVDPKTLTPDFNYAEKMNSSGEPTGEYLNYNTTSEDSTKGMLKYRFNHMVKADLELEYKKWAVGVGYRYYSKMQNIDKAIRDLEYMTETGNIFLDELKYTNFWESHNGQSIFDARVSYKLSDKHKFSVICNNFLNSAYSLRPLKIEAPRTTSIQYILTL